MENIFKSHQITVLNMILDRWSHKIWLYRFYNLFPRKSYHRNKIKLIRYENKRPPARINLYLKNRRKINLYFLTELSIRNRFKRKISLVGEDHDRDINSDDEASTSHKRFLRRIKRETIFSEMRDQRGTKRTPKFLKRETSRLRH